MKSTPISRLLGVPLEWHHFKGRGDALALVTVSNRRNRIARSTGNIMIILNLNFYRRSCSFEIVREIQKREIGDKK